MSLALTLDDNLSSYFTTDPSGSFPLLVGDQYYNNWCIENYSEYIPSGNEIMSSLESKFYSQEYLEKVKVVNREKEAENLIKRKREEEELRKEYDHYGFQHLFSDETSVQEHEQYCFQRIHNYTFTSAEQHDQFNRYISFLKYLYRKCKSAPHQVWKDCYVGKNTLGFKLLKYDLFVLGAQVVVDYIIIKQLKQLEIGELWC